MLYTDNGELECFDEAMETSARTKWEHAMKEEMDSLLHNQTWSLVKLPKCKKALTNKWVYRIKEEGNRQRRYKERLVVKHFVEKKGIDFNEIFSPVVKMKSIRTILSIVAIEKSIS